MILQFPIEHNFKEGDLVRVKGMDDKDHFCIIGMKTEGKQKIAVLKALYGRTYIIEKPVTELSTLLIRGKL
jgi:uncharacterized protein YqfB (UPF0267 family)